MPLSKFETNLILCVQVRCASFSLYSLASLCLNDDFRAYVIIDFLANQLVFSQIRSHGCYQPYCTEVEQVMCNDKVHKYFMSCEQLYLQSVDTIS